MYKLPGPSKQWHLARFKGTICKELSVLNSYADTSGRASGHRLADILDQSPVLHLRYAEGQQSEQDQASCLRSSKSPQNT